MVIANFVEQHQQEDNDYKPTLLSKANTSRRSTTTQQEAEVPLFAQQEEGETLTMMSPDDDRITPRRLEDTTAIINDPPTKFRAAPINTNLLQALGCQVCRQMADRRDEHNCKQNTHKTNAPKIKEFKCYCEIFYIQNVALYHQVRKSKVKAYLFYCFYQEVKPRGRQKGKFLTGEIHFDYEQANKIIRNKGEYHKCIGNWTL